VGDGSWFEIVNIEWSSMWQFPGRFMPHSLQVAQEHSVSGPTCRAGNDLRIEPRHVGVTQTGFESGTKWQFPGAVSRIRPPVNKALSSFSHSALWHLFFTGH
jgi:hypothetical protein